MRFQTPDHESLPIVGKREGALTRWVRAPLAALAFWAAIAIPVLYLPLLLSGIESRTGLGLFLGLVGVHLLTLIGGRNYHSRSR